MARKQQFDAEVKMESGKKHWLRIEATSADAAMTSIIRQMAPFEVYSMRLRPATGWVYGNPNAEVQR